jgi:hypothetical protein
MGGFLENSFFRERRQAINFRAGPHPRKIPVASYLRLFGVKVRSVVWAPFGIWIGRSRTSSTLAPVEGNGPYQNWPVYHFGFDIY